MADSRKFRFVSPGIFINEIDRSQLPAETEVVGPLVMGRTQRGPSMVPVKVKSYEEFVRVFGDPIPGNQQGGDVWREGNYTAPTYGAYAAKAYLNVGSTPLTFVRLAGVDSDNASAASVRSQAGWNITQYVPGATALSSSAESFAGAYGLFVFGTSSQTAVTGTLGAVFYTSGAAIFPSTSVGYTSAPTSQSGSGMNKIFYGSSVEDTNITLQFSGSVNQKKRISLDRSSPDFIRNVLNTNPQFMTKTRKDAVSVEDSSNQKYYFVGETYERTVSELITGNSLNGGYGFAVIPLYSGSAAASTKTNHNSSLRDAQTPWFISQDLTADTASYTVAGQQKLFKLVSLNGQGDWVGGNLKVSIENIKFSVNENDDYSYFDVVLRSAQDSDVKPVIVERFSRVNLNPNSPDFIGDRIGDQYLTYDQVTNTLRTVNNRPNNSTYVRVVLDEAVLNGDTAPSAVPFGFYGIPKPKNATFTLAGHKTTTVPDGLHYKAGYLSGDIGVGGAGYFLSASSDFCAANAEVKIVYPVVPLRSSSISLKADHTLTFFGVDTGRSETVSIHNPGWNDYVRFMGEDAIPESVWADYFGTSLSASAYLEYEPGFSMDDLYVERGAQYNFSASPRYNIVQVAHIPGSRAAGTSFTSLNAGGNLPSVPSYKNILLAGVRGFTAPFFGGFDGLSVFEREPLRNTYIQSGDNRDTNYVYEVYDRALNVVKEPENVEFNILTIPGLTNETFTRKAIETCEDRGDAMAVIDLAGGYVPPHEEYIALSANRKGNLKTVLDAVDARNLNSSYGAAYYPWVTVRDDSANSLLKVPPSVVALGVLGNTETVADVWFAPAGFNRGGLSNGTAGLPVLDVETRLSSKDRDDLYFRNINPIAQFPAEGIVVFGQKTLQVSPVSALTRINVRRLLIFLKKGISQISSSVLFEQNVEATWNDFRTRAEDFLSGVKTRLGLDDYKVVLDETTTTPDLVDRNIMYAKVFIKPTRTIEFIALDFIITRAGASFED